MQHNVLIQLIQLTLHLILLFKKLQQVIIALTVNLGIL